MKARRSCNIVAGIDGGFGFGGRRFTCVLRRVRWNARAVTGASGRAREWAVGIHVRSFPFGVIRFASSRNGSAWVQKRLVQAPAQVFPRHAVKRTTGNAMTGNSRLGSPLPS